MSTQQSLYKYEVSFHLLNYLVPCDNRPSYLSALADKLVITTSAFFNEDAPRFHNQRTQPCQSLEVVGGHQKKSSLHNEDRPGTLLTYISIYGNPVIR